MKRVSFSNEHLAEAVRGWDPDYDVTVHTVPTTRGSVAFLGHGSDRAVLKCATLAQQQTEVDIDPPRSVGIRNEAGHQLTLPPGIAPQLYVYAERPDIVYSISEFLSGDNLGEVARQRALTTATSRWLVHSMIAEAERLHQAGTLHGDWHPENMMVTDAGHLKPIDFEFAHPIGGGALAPGLCHYVSPAAARQILDHEPPLLDQREEVFAVAATAYTVLTGALPHAYSRPDLNRTESLGEVATIARYASTANLASPDNLLLAKALGELLEAPLAERPATPTDLYKELSPCL